MSLPTFPTLTLPSGTIASSDVNTKTGAPSNRPTDFNNQVFRHYADSTKWGDKSNISLGDVRGKNYNWANSKVFSGTGNSTFTVPADVYQIYVTWPINSGITGQLYTGLTPGQVLTTTNGGMAGSGKIGTLNIPAYNYSWFSQGFSVDWHIYLYINLFTNYWTAYDTKSASAGTPTFYNSFSSDSIVQGLGGINIYSKWSARSTVYMNNPDGSWNVYYGVRDDPGGSDNYSVTAYVQQNSYFKVYW